MPDKTDEQRALIELALHQNSLFTCLDEEQISKCVHTYTYVCPAATHTDTALDLTHPNRPRSPTNRFVKEARLLEFEPGEVIFAQGEKGYDCFIVDDGEAEIFDQSEDGTLESIVRKSVRALRGRGGKGHVHLGRLFSDRRHACVYSHHKQTARGDLRGGVHDLPPAAIGHGAGQGQAARLGRGRRVSDFVL